MQLFKKIIFTVLLIIFFGACNVGHSPQKMSKQDDPSSNRNRLFKKSQSGRIESKVKEPVTIKESSSKASSDPFFKNSTFEDTVGLIDYDGNHYKVISIGKQTWMAENLKVSCYHDGTPIENVADINVWSNLTTGAYCWFGNDSISYAGTYGALYNWYAVNTDKLCPAGWHVPKDYEWEILINYLGGMSTAGGKLKETDTVHWYYPNTGATNETGFAALPGGGRSTDGVFGNHGLNSIFWSSTEFDEKYALFRNISYYYREIYGYGSNKKNGYSVRCVKDK